MTKLGNTSIGNFSLSNNLISFSRGDVAPNTIGILNMATLVFGKRKSMFSIFILKCP